MWINGKEYTQEELQKIVDECFDRTAFAKALGWAYYNGKLSKKIDEIVNATGISIIHFDPVKKNKARRLYSIVEKNCPVCGEKFETQQGHPKEAITCSCKCANTFFSDQKHGAEQRLKTSHALLKRSGSDTISEIVHGEVFFRKVCGFCGVNFLSGKHITMCCSASCAGKMKWKNTPPENRLDTLVRKMVSNGTHKGWATRSKLEPSFPEKVVIGILEELDIKLERELKINKWFIDFADVKRKIAIEIDGRQHKLPERKLSDANKDIHLISEGWQVNRIPWKRLTKESREELKNKLIEILNQDVA